MGLFDALDASGSALSAERVRMDVTAENLANAQSTRTANGKGAYRRKEVVLQEAGAGVGSRATFADSLNAKGYVEMPNVNTVTEMTDLIGASRAYEANVTAMQTTKAMFARTLDLLK
jgi:flagellar basal-body rod protein FlgC